MNIGKVLRMAAIGLAVIALPACTSTWSYSDVEATPTAATAPKQTKTTLPSDISIVEGAVTDREFTALGDLEVTVNKTFIFSEDPTRAQTDVEFRKEAAKLGADAVINVVYGEVTLSLFSYGSMTSTGTAIRYTE